MSNYIPIFIYPGGDLLQNPPEADDYTIYKWIDDYGGEILPGPIDKGTSTPIGTKEHGGVMTVSQNGIKTIEYHYSGYIYSK